jgi:hypothetical protein
MIKRAIFSYLNSEESFSNKGGFIRFGDLLFSTALAVYAARRQFDEVIMVSTDWGIDLFKSIDLPVTGYSNALNPIKNISKYFWAYGKIIAYAEQNVPFVHIDNDFYLWGPLPSRILNAQLCFQSHEPFNLPGYRYYQMLKTPWNDAPIKPIVIKNNEITDYAYNCGICGGHNLDFFEEWKKCSAEYIFAKENQNIFFKKHANVLIHQNLFHEQYFAACLTKKFNLRDQVEVIAPDVNDINNFVRCTHLWGNTKKSLKYTRALWNIFERVAPDLYEKIYMFNFKNNI